MDDFAYSNHTSHMILIAIPTFRASLWTKSTDEAAISGVWEDSCISSVNCSKPKESWLLKELQPVNSKGLVTGCLWLNTVQLGQERKKRKINSNFKSSKVSPFTPCAFWRCLGLCRYSAVISQHRWLIRRSFTFRDALFVWSTPSKGYIGKWHIVQVFELRM